MAQRRPNIDDLLPARGLREELLRGPSGIDFETQGMSIRVVNLPLFRWTEDGNLAQALRVIVQAHSEMGEVIFSVFEGKTLLDHTTSWISAGRNLLYLFVPEVYEARSVTFEVKNGARKPFRTDVEVRPQRKWLVYLVHHSHLDIGYTDTQSSVLRHHLQYLDSVLDLCSATDNWSDDAKFRWNIEATWPMQHWLRTRPKADRDKLLERIRLGRIEVCALPFNMHTEAYSIDELARQLRFADELRERYELPVTTAMQTDVPGTTLGLLNLLVDAGVRYLSVAHNYAGRSVPHLVGGEKLTRPFWWQAANGKRLLVWYTDTPHGSAYMEGNLLGLAEDYETALGALPGYLKALEERPYPYGEHKHTFGWLDLLDGTGITKRPYPHDVLHLRVQGAIADNAAPSIAPAEISRRWNEQWAYPRLRLATNREFFEFVEGHLGDKLETYSGDWTDWWADGLGSAARHLGFNRRAQADIRTAQTLHTLADTLVKDKVDVSSEIDAASENMALFDEHTWGAFDPWNNELDGTESGVLQWEKKASFAREAYDKSDALVRSGMRRLSYIFPKSDHSLASVAVVNPSGWSRTDLVRVFVPLSMIGPQRPLAIVDATTGQRVPHAVEEQEHARYRPRGIYVSFIAHNVPPCGYACYEIIEGEPEKLDKPSQQDGPVVENEHYLVRLDLMEGFVSELLDKDSGGQLVNTNAPFGFNQYIYDRYTSAPHFNHLSGRLVARDLSLLGKRSTTRYGVLTDHSSNCVWDRMTVRLNGEGADFVETTLTLLRGIKRLHIRNRIHKIGTPQKESVFFAFPFNLEDPSVIYEITGGVDSPAMPRIPGSAEHMRAIRHWVGLESSMATVAWATLEAPLVQFGNIHLPYAPFPQTIDPKVADPATIYSWVLNNIWDTNFPPQQQGEMEFCYAISTGTETDARGLGMRTAAALTAPLLGILSAPFSRGRLPARGSFCSVGCPEVEVVHLAPSRRGHDLVLFLQSNAPTSVEVRVSFPLLQIRRAWTCTHLERNLREASMDSDGVRISMQPGELSVLSLDLKTDGI